MLMLPEDAGTVGTIERLIAYRRGKALLARLSNAKPVALLKLSEVLGPVALSHDFAKTQLKLNATDVFGKVRIEFVRQIDDAEKKLGVAGLTTLMNRWKVITDFVKAKDRK